MTQSLKVWRSMPTACGVLAAHAGQRIGDRKQPPSYARAGFGLGQFAKHRWRAIPLMVSEVMCPSSYFMRRGDHGLLRNGIAAVQQELVFRYGGIMQTDNLLAPLVQRGEALIACIVVAHAKNAELLRRNDQDISGRVYKDHIQPERRLRLGRHDGDPAGS